LLLVKLEPHPLQPERRFAPFGRRVSAGRLARFGQEYRKHLPRRLALDAEHLGKQFGGGRRGVDLAHCPPPYAASRELGDLAASAGGARSSRDCAEAPIPSQKLRREWPRRTISHGHGAMDTDLYRIQRTPPHVRA